MNEFQWTLNNENLTNETGPVLDLSDITADSHGGVYTCTVSNEAGSDEDSFTVNVSPIFTQQPVLIVVEVLIQIELECRASGFPEPTYQWFKVGGELSGNVTGDNTSRLRFNPVYYGDEGDYFCQVTSGNITINSSTATLAGRAIFHLLLFIIILSPAVSPKGTVVISPANGSFSVGNDGNLTCSAMGGPRNMFQWYKNGNKLEGENSTVLTLTNITLDDGDEYLCAVRNLGEAFNTTTFVFINPVITEHPSDIETTNGSSVVLECRAEAFPDPTYQWTYSNGSEISSGSIGGADTDRLEFLPAEFGVEGGYVCTATANGVTATSDVAVLFCESPCIDSDTISSSTFCSKLTFSLCFLFF